MRRIVMAVCCSGVLGVSGMAMAQAGNADKMHKEMGKAVKVTGCVAQGSDMNHFMLNNAMMSGDMMKSDAMKKDPMMKDDMKPMSYALSGGALKAHIGHKVEVTGSMAAEPIAKKDAMQKTNMDKDKDMMAAMHTLNVTSVKMIAATCT